MKEYLEAAMERMMKGQDIVLRALAGKLKWFQAAESSGISLGHFWGAQPHHFSPAPKI